jgi:hypothetical protein
MFGDPLGGLLFGGETLDYFRLAIGPKNIDHPAKSGITFSRHESGSVFGHLANMRLRRAGSSRSSDNNQTDRPQPAVDGNTAPAKAAREGLATARPVVFAASAGRFWISQERQGVISWFEFIVFRRDIVVGSLFGGHQFLGKAAPKITLRCFHQPGHQIFRHSVDRSILIDFGVD